MKKYMSFLLAGAMALSATTVSFGANFSDINNVPWCRNIYQSSSR